MGCSGSKAKTRSSAEEPIHSPVGVASPSSHPRDSTTGMQMSQLSDESIKKKLSNASAPIYRIVLTGGPCAGKSTLLALIQTKFAQRTGFKVYCVPEAATLLVGAGLEWTDMTDEKIVEYQLALLRVQIALEDQLYAVARANKTPSIVVSDRGTMDGRAYCTTEQFTEIMHRGGWNLETLRDERYDAIVHMVSAAIGAKEYYNFDNPARYENEDEAVIADERLRQMYVGHPLLRVFDNSTTFDQKLERVMQFIAQVVGHEFPHNLTRRFILSRPLLESELPPSHVRARITLSILHNSTEDEVMQVMKREQDKACVFFYICIKKKTDRTPRARSVDSLGNSQVGSNNNAAAGGGAAAATITDNNTATASAADFPSVKSEHRITAREYASLLLQRDPDRVDVIKDNISFVHGSYYCEVATFVSPPWAVGQTTLYIDSDDRTKLELPQFLSSLVEGERTDGSVTSFQIAQKSNIGRTSNAALTKE